MGTRSLTYFFQDGKPFCAFYRQMDGYPEGHGADLGKILAPLKLVNGIGLDMHAGEFANGPGCLAAQVIANLKNEHGLGGIYLIAPELNIDSWQEYEYHVHVNARETEGYQRDDAFDCYIEVRNPKDVIFTGSFEEFYRWAQKPTKDAYGDYVPVTGRKVAPPKFYPTLRGALHKEVVSVKFTKADGSTRLMKCTTDPDRIPEDKAPIGGNIPLRIDRKLYKVFDLEKNDWRSFREERIIDWTVF